MAWDGTDDWYTFVCRWRSDQPEEFVYCFKPKNIHNPAPVMAREIVNMFESKFPKLWAALTNRTVTVKAICGDGAPVVSKTVDELRKYPQFYLAKYYYDPCHSQSVTAKHSIKHSSILTGQVMSHFKRFATLVNHSGCVKKQVKVERDKNVKRLDRHYERFFYHGPTRGNGIEQLVEQELDDGELEMFEDEVENGREWFENATTDMSSVIANANGDNLEDTEDFEREPENENVNNFKIKTRWNYHQQRSKTRFTGNDKHYDSNAYLYSVTIAVCTSLRPHKDHGPLANGLLKSACDITFNFEFIFDHRFFRIAAVCNLRLQAKQLSRGQILDSFGEWKKSLMDLQENLHTIAEKAKDLTKYNMNKIGAFWMTSRSARSSENIDTFGLNYQPFESAIEFCIKQIDENIKAVQKSCDGQLLYSSMFCETTFSIFEKIRDKYSLTIQNPLLYLQMCGTLQPRRMARLDVEKLAKLFLTK